MFYDLSKNFAKFLFEPIFTFFILGLVVFAILYWKRNLQLVLWVMGSLIFMFMVRALAPITDISSRYFASFTVVGILFTMIFLRDFELIINKFTSRFKHYKVCRNILFTVLVISCLARDFSYNYYDDYCIKISEKILADAKGEPYMVFTTELSRLEYYLNSKNVSEFLGSERNKRKTDSLVAISDIVSAYDSSNHIIYITVLSRAQETPFELEPQNGKIEFLSRQFINNKKDKCIDLYRYDANSPIECIQKDDYETPQKGKNSTIFCDFEIPLNGDSIKKRMVESGHTFYANKDLELPAYWNFWIPPTQKIKNIFKVYLSNNNPIAGKKSLVIDPEIPTDLFTDVNIPSGNYQVKFLAMAEERCAFQIRLLLFKDGDKSATVNELKYYIIDNGNINMLSFDIAEQQLNGADYFRISILVKDGKLKIDDFIVDEI